MEHDFDVKLAIGWAIKAAIAVIALMILFGSFYVIGVGQVGVIFNQATGRTKSVQSGFSLKIPVEPI